jgi:hypothetical protein
MKKEVTHEAFRESAAQSNKYYQYQEGIKNL